MAPKASNPARGEAAGLGGMSTFCGVDNPHIVRPRLPPRSLILPSNVP
jgi:hypothetical protein